MTGTKRLALLRTDTCITASFHPATTTPHGIPHVQTVLATVGATDTSSLHVLFLVVLVATYDPCVHVGSREPGWSTQ